MLMITIVIVIIIKIMMNMKWVFMFRVMRSESLVSLARIPRIHPPLLGVKKEHLCISPACQYIASSFQDFCSVSSWLHVSTG